MLALIFLIFVNYLTTGTLIFITTSTFIFINVSMLAEIRICL